MSFFTDPKNKTEFVIERSHYFFKKQSHLACLFTALQFCFKPTF